MYMLQTYSEICHQFLIIFIVIQLPNKPYQVDENVNFQTNMPTFGLDFMLPSICGFITSIIVASVAIWKIQETKIIG